MGVKDWIDARMQDALMVGVLIASFAWLIFIGSIVPEYSGILGPIGYFAIIFGGLFGTEIVVREYVNSYPYLRVLVRPENKWLHLFLKPPGTTKRIAPNMYATTLDLRFPVKYNGHTVKRIELHHHGRWSERIRFSRGNCVWSGFTVPHPQTEIVEVFRVPKASVMIDRNEAVPVFMLRSASQDFYHGVPDFERVFNQEDLMEQLELMRIQLAEAERQKAEWHHRAISAEEIIEQQKNEIRGLMAAKSGLKELAYEYMLTIFQATGSIDKAMKRLKGTSISSEIAKYAMITVLGVAIIGLLWANPGIITALASNAIFLVVAVIIGVAAVMYLQNSKGRKK